MTRNYVAYGELCLRTLAAGCQPPESVTAKPTAKTGGAVMSAWAS